MNYIIYTRRSSEGEDKQMESIPAQINILNQLTKQYSLKVSHLFKESKSAKKPGRKYFNEMIEAIDDGDVEGIVCWKLNRLFRNPEDEGKIRQRLSDGRLQKIVTPNKTYTEADSDFMMAVEGAQAQRFIRDLREDTKRGINRKLEKGIAPILAPVGYKNNTHKRQGERDISEHPLYFRLVRKVMEIAMTGNYTLIGLAKEAKKLGIKNNRGKYISKSQMLDILKNPFYKGKFIYAGEEYQGKHKPMLTDEEFNLLQRIVSDRSRPRTQKHDDLLTGLMKCGECGMQITAEKHTKKYKNSTSQTFTYYRCTKKGEDKCNQPYLPAKKLQEQVLDFLDTVTISQKFIDWAVECLNDANEEHKDVSNLKIKSLQKQFNLVNKKLDNLLELKISPENLDNQLISDEEFISKKSALAKEKSELKNEIQKVDLSKDTWFDFSVKTFNFVAKCKDKFEYGNIDEKKIILRTIGSNLIIQDKKLAIEPRKMFKPFITFKENIERLEPTNDVFFEANMRNYAQYAQLVGE